MYVSIAVFLWSCTISTFLLVTFYIACDWLWTYTTYIFKLSVTDVIVVGGEVFAGDYEGINCIDEIYTLVRDRKDAFSLDTWE